MSALPLKVLHAAVAGRFEMATKPVPLSEVEQAWSSDAYMPRVVFTDLAKDAVLSNNATPGMDRKESCRLKRRSCDDRSGNGLFLDRHFKPR